MHLYINLNILYILCFYQYYNFSFYKTSAYNFILIANKNSNFRRNKEKKYDFKISVVYSQNKINIELYILI